MFLFLSIVHIAQTCKAGRRRLGSNSLFEPSHHLYAVLVEADNLAVSFVACEAIHEVSKLVAVHIVENDLIIMLDYIYPKVAVAGGEVVRFHAVIIISEHL